MKDEVKNLGNTSIEDVTNDWVTINRKENTEKRWLKLIQAFQLETGCLVKTSTEFRNVNWNVVACSEGVTFIPNTKIVYTETEAGDIKYVLLVPMTGSENITIQKLLDTKPKTELDTKVFEKVADSFIGGKDKTVKTIDNENKKK
jgi:hypothetical protein